MSQLIKGERVKIYTALLTQTGTSAPVANVLENTLGGTVVWTRIDVGNYVATLTGAFTLNKTFVFVSCNIFDGVFIVGANPVDANTIELYTWDFVEVVEMAGDLVFVEIRVYP
jgi:hypothetical protein